MTPFVADIARRSALEAVAGETYSEDINPKCVCGRRLFKHGLGARIDDDTVVAFCGDGLETFTEWEPIFDEELEWEAI